MTADDEHASTLLMIRRLCITGFLSILGYCNMQTLEEDLQYLETYLTPTGGKKNTDYPTTLNNIANLCI